MELYHLKLKTQKVQSFIFKVPKLKAMLGANSLLGEFFAKDLPKLREGFGKFNILEKGKISENDENEKKELNKDFIWQNDDIVNHFENGINCSAGGHFESIFKERGDAVNFLKEAITKAKEKIPGVTISYFLRKFNDTYSFKKYEDKYLDDKEDITEEISEVLPLIDCPYFYPSTEDGENPALLYSKDNDSLMVKKIKEQGNKFYSLNTDDFLCKLLKMDMKLKKDEIPNSLEDIRDTSFIPGNNKMALIAIDGNGMGDRFNSKREELKNKNKNVLDTLIEIENFWFDARNNFRIALQNAFKKCCNLDSYIGEITDVNGKTKTTKLPFIVLMLGGDDLLLITVPEIAFDFVKCFNNKLTEIASNVTFSTGIAFVRYDYPFVHAHELAESLLSSAKYKSRENAQLSNAVDWHIHFSSMYNDIKKIRLRDYYHIYDNTIEILTKRPYSIDDLSTLYSKAEETYKLIQRDEGIGRNKIKTFETILKQGKYSSKLYGKILFEKEESIKDLYTYDEEEINGKKIYINNALDIIELLDLFKRKDNAEKNSSKQEVTDETY
ncbi:MAG: hypothetical protein KAW92_07135 [Candidatus Cloacimonetes bacterium]|nr:hypothetical protein [Candidatus Cloacimonadota bacterium]